MENNHLPKSLKKEIRQYQPETWSFVQKIALKKKVDVSAVVNDLLKSDIKIMEYIKQ